jgi:hypothetical protein
MPVRTGSCIMTVTGQEVVESIETVSGTGLYSVVTNKVNLSLFLSPLPLFLLPSSLSTSFLLSLIPSISPQSTLSHICRQYISHSDSFPSSYPTSPTPHNTQEFVVINGIVASPFAKNHFVANIFYNLHRAIYATFPYVLQCNSVKQSNEVRGRCESLTKFRS